MIPPMRPANTKETRGERDVSRQPRPISCLLQNRCHSNPSRFDEISRVVSPGAHAVLLIDRAGWHTTGKLKIPTNITLLSLPSRAPELNPVEHLWQFLRQTYLSNRVFETYEEILDAACEAWNHLIDQPWRIMSIGLRDWAHNGHSF